MERLFYIPTSGPTPPPVEDFPGAESVSFASADGTELHGWFIPAQTRESGDPPPTVLHVHGNAGNITSHIWFTEYLPAAGCNLFIFDYRGYGESDGSPRRRGKLIEDTEAALETVLHRDDVDPTRIGMYGQSLGGGIGLNVMASRHEIACAVIESAFTSWREIAADALGGAKAGVIARGLARVLIPDGHRPVDAIARIRRPILLIHGTADTIIPFDHSRRLAEAAGDGAKLHPLPGGDHNTLRSTHPEIDRLVINFYRTHLATTNSRIDNP